MKISKKWLDNFFDGGLPDTQAVCDALTFHAFEIDGVDHANGDDILDVKVTANRGHDCLSHRGIAKELSAILGRPLKNDPFALEFDLSKTTDEVSVTIEDPTLCPRYIAAYIRGVKVAASPEWLRSSLENLGQRSINNVVDATNMVMFNTGQPLHAFDAKRLGSLDIGVRRAREGESMEALDGQIYKLNPSLLVITAADRPAGIAGIKGGMADKIDESTTDLIIESANFDGVTIRKGSQQLKLRTDASTRFEQGLSPELALIDMRQVVKLITETMGGEPIGVVDVYPQPQEIQPVSVTLEKINAVLGANYTDANVEDVFNRLEFSFEKKSLTYTVTPPPERLDIQIPEDLVEEVGRIIGYDHVAAKELPPLDRKPAVNGNFYAAEKKREELAAAGYSEVYTSVFADKGERVVLNKIDAVKPYLRSTLTENLKDAYEKNKRNAESLGLKEVKLFEIGTIWKDGKEMTMVGIADKKGVREEPLSAPDVIPDSYEQLPLSSAERYQPFSKYPFIIRDVAFWCPMGVDAAEIEENIRELAGALCIKIFLFDRFEKNDTVSLAFRLVFQSFDRTLTEEEVAPNMEAVYAMLKGKGFEIR